MRRATSRARRVMGLDPGTRHLGTAVLEGNELIHHAVFDVSGRTSRECLSQVRRQIGRLIAAYEPDLVVIERTFFSRGRNAPLLRLVGDELNALTSERGVHTVLVAPTTLKKDITGHGHANKQQVAEAVCGAFPRLMAYRGETRKWKNRYHSNRFDAVAAAIRGAKTDSPSRGRSR